MFGRDNNPVFDSDDEETEVRVISTTTFCEIRWYLTLSGSVKAALKLSDRACYCCSQTAAAALLWTYAVTSAEIPLRLFAWTASPLCVYRPACNHLSNQNQTPQVSIFTCTILVLAEDTDTVVH